MRKIKKRIKRTIAWRRWKAESPELFKKLIKLGITVGAIGTGILASPIILPLFLITIAPTLISIGATTALVAKFTVKDPKVLQ